MAWSGEERLVVVCQGAAAYACVREALARHGRRRFKVDGSALSAQLHRAWMARSSGTVPGVTVRPWLVTVRSFARRGAARTKTHRQSHAADLLLWVVLTLASDSFEAGCQWLRLGMARTRNTHVPDFWLCLCVFFSVSSFSAHAQAQARACLTPA